MEFHIARELRQKLGADEVLFAYNGNVVFADVTASRRLALNLEQMRLAAGQPTDGINAGALFAAGLIDELNHALIAQYRDQFDSSVMSDALRWFAAQAAPAKVTELLLAFTEQFPNVDVYHGVLTAKQWLAKSTDGVSNREAALEELLLLWIANSNPALMPFRDLFEDAGLKRETFYDKLTNTFPNYFATRPTISPAIGTLLDALRAPILASPDSLTGQLEFIRQTWSGRLGEDLPDILLAIDVLREDEIAVWMRFHPPSPGHFRHGNPNSTHEGFVGDEYVGFDDQFHLDRDSAGHPDDELFLTGADGVRRRRYSADYQAPLVEYENFSADQAWMPNVVLIAKSTYVWLEQLSKKYLRHIYRLDQIPDEEFHLLASRGVTGLWLIGLWERSTASQTIKRLRGNDYAVASAYSLKDYGIAADLGGNEAYEALRDRAGSAGIRLASDMVPNHMGIDSNWVIEHPDWFISRPESPFPVYSFEGPDLSTDSRVEIKIEDHYYDQTDAAVVFRLRHHANGQTRFMYHGNDGTTFAWNDTAQLDYSKAYVREHIIQIILQVARLFPIIRFDAAMVLAKRHVQRLWFPLPGAGGSIPSRSEDAMSQDQFDALMPAEFWREVVDRVAVEVPGTLLLAEAFWLLEGYFVRTLGMHRVYNSAFMNMLRDEENAKYRSYLKKTVEFDPDILKRYVNFMSNPDERTAVDQFGDGDKYFGTCTLLATLPGLPMLSHGQIEGYTERYGMDFKQAKQDERPREDLVDRHQRQIAPLLKHRSLFAESTNFHLYDLWTGNGSVDENVFAYSNREGSERSLILYNNTYGSTSGTLHTSVAAMDKGSGTLRQTSLADGLGLASDENFFAYRDVDRNLEFLHSVRDLRNGGLFLNLGGYQRIVFLHWRELYASAAQPWDQLCWSLAGAGVENLDHALARLQIRPLVDALRYAVDRSHFEPPQIAPSEIATSEPSPAAPSGPDFKVLPSPRSKKTPPESARMTDRAKGVGGAPHAQAVSTPAPHLQHFVDSSTGVLQALGQLPEAAALTHLFVSIGSLALQPELPRILAEPAPLASRRVSAPLLAWLVLRNVAQPQSALLVFDRLPLRQALRDAFESLGMYGEDGWRAAAAVRILLLLDTDLLGTSLSEAFWHDSDVRWLCGIHDSSGVTYLNREQAAELVLILGHAAAASGSPSRASLATLSADIEAAGYRLDALLAGRPGMSPPHPPLPGAAKPAPPPTSKPDLPSTPKPARAGDQLAEATSLPGKAVPEEAPV